MGDQISKQRHTNLQSVPCPFFFFFLFFLKKTQSLQARIGDIAGHVLLLSEAGLNMFGASAEEPPHRHNKEREKEEIKKLLTNPPNML